MKDLGVKPSQFLHFNIFNKRCITAIINGTNKMNSAPVI